MKLVKFDKSNSITPRVNAPAVTLKANGQIVLNGEAIKTIGLIVGDTIALLQNQEAPTEWYLTKDKDGFRLRKSGKNNPVLLASNPKVVGQINTSLGIEAGKTVRFKLNPQPVKHDKMVLYSIATAEPVIRESKATEELAENA